MRNKSLFLSAILSLCLANFVFAGDKYKLDVVHSSIGFSARHMVVSTIKGRFKDFSGTIVLDEEDMSKSSVMVTIKTTSVDTENEQRDKHLRSADFFDAEKFPEMIFKSKSIAKKGDGYVAVGDLTMHGVTKEVNLPFTLAGPIAGRRGKLIGVEASLSLNRQDYGIAFSRTLEAGGLMVSNEIKISLALEAGEVKEETN